MEIYLVQHGEAYPEEVDPQRKLTAKGKEQIELAGEVLKRFALKFDSIISSPKLRARQTAEIIAERTGFLQEIEVTETLNPTVPAEAAIDYLGKLGAKDRLLLAGHLPSLAEIGSLLLSEKDKILLGIQMGGICRIDVEDLSAHRGILRWFLLPAHVELIARSAALPSQP